MKKLCNDRSQPFPITISNPNLYLAMVMVSFASAKKAFWRTNCVDIAHSLFQSSSPTKSHRSKKVVTTIAFIFPIAPFGLRSRVTAEHTTDVGFV